jgi:hypothetical protein
MAQATDESSTNVTPYDLLTLRTPSGSGAIAPSGASGRRLLRAPLRPRCRVPLRPLLRLSATAALRSPPRP